MSLAASQCVRSALSKLSWAYLDRVEASDWTRASIVLSKIASFYNGRRDLVVEALGVPNLPARADDGWTRETQHVVGALLLSSLKRADGSFTSADAERAFNAMVAGFPGDASRLGPFYTAHLKTAPLPEWQAWNAVVATRDPAMVPEGIDALIRSHVSRECTTTSPTSTQVVTSSGAIVDLEPVKIIGDSGRMRFPTWGYYVIGAAAIGVVGVLGYNAYVGRL